MNDESNGEVLDISDAKFIGVVYNIFLLIKPHIVGTAINSNWRVNALRIVKKDIDFKLISIQLSFFYDILHTKATLVHFITFYVVRIASLVAMVIAFFFFHFTEKRGYEISDLIITYILLSVALFLEIYSALRLVLSKWMIISLLRLNKKGATKIANFIFRAKNHIFCRGNKGQWSGRMRQNRLMSLMKKESNWFKKAWNFLFGGEESAEVPSILEETLINHVKNLIKSVRQFEDYPDLLRKLRSTWMMMNALDHYNLPGIQFEVGQRTFEQCVMAWHMATDICYITSNNAPGDSEEGRMREALYRVSNYMMYILLERTSMMPRGIAQTEMEDTLKEYRKLWRNVDDGHYKPYGLSEFVSSFRPDHNHYKPYRLSEFVSSFPPDDNYRSAFVFFRLILEDLANIEGETEERIKVRWVVIRDAWMGMLTYSALHCSKTEHARGLSRGGELLTHYWLLMAHYGLMDEYNEGAGWEMLSRMNCDYN